MQKLPALARAGLMKSRLTPFSMMTAGSHS